MSLNVPKCLVYVKGYEIENQSTEYIVGRKARGSDHIRSQDEKLIYNNIGNYVIVQNNASNPVFGGSQLGFFGNQSPTSIFGPRQMKLALHDATGVQIGCANAVQLQQYVQQTQPLSENNLIQMV